MSNALLWLLFLPLATAVVVGLLGAKRPELTRWLSLAASVVCLALAVAVAVDFASKSRSHGDTAAAPTFHPELVTRTDLLPLQQPAPMTNGPAEGGVIQFYIGIDGLNIWLVVLTALLEVSCVLVSWTAITDRTNEFYAWLLALETAMLGVFLSFDIILFYVFFELTLVPLFFLIGIWGGPQRQYAARKFFIYTLSGSLVTLMGVLGVVLTLYQQNVTTRLTFSIPRLVRLVGEQNTKLTMDVRAAHDEEAAAADNKPMPEGVPSRLESARQQVERTEDALAYWYKVQFWVFAALMVGFAIKVPLFPVHTWLPLAHVEAPTAGSVLLAGVLLKVGTYGFLRLCVPLAPDASLTFGAPLLGSLAVVGILYGAFCALAQDDFKKLVAYSSVSHLGFCILGLFALTEVGMTGSLLQMVNHGLSTGALFLLVGMLYERYHTRKMADYGGMGARLHLLAVFMVFITMSSVGLPGLNGFLGEVMVFLGTFDYQGPRMDGRLLAVLACGGMVLGAWYMLTMVRRVFFGPLKEPPVHHDAASHGPVGDLSIREVAALAPIALVCLALGVYPKPFFDTVAPDLKVVSRIADGARVRAGGPSELPATARAGD